MKVLLITHYSDLYGANLSLCNVAMALKKLYKIEVSVLCLAPNGKEFKEYLKKEAGVDVTFCRFYNTTYPVGNFKGYIKSYVASLINQIKIVKLDKFMKSNRFDLIHTNTMATMVGAQLAKRYKIPHIWHIREFLEEDYASSQINNFIFKRSLDYTSVYIAISNAVKNKYIGLLDKDKVKVIYNGIPKLHRKNKVHLGKTIFCIVGVIRREKGILEAIQAFAGLDHQKYKECELWIIGGGMDQENEYISEIKSVVKKIDLGKKIKFLGYRNDVLELLDQVDVGLVCSKLEAFGRVTIEYMMKEIYVIGANSGGTAELIEDGKTGSLYEAGNYRDLKDKMIEYLDKKINTEEVISRAKEFSDKFTIQNCVANIYSVYEDIMNERN